MKSLIEVNEFLKEITGGEPLYKDSLQYGSFDWKLLSKCKVKNPVQRQLTPGECVFDLDGVTPDSKSLILEFLRGVDMKFMAWNSGPDGLHINFWTNIKSKEGKKILVEEMGAYLTKTYGVGIDLGPMGHSVIRSEFAFHPTKGYQKTFIESNISTLFPLNEVPRHIQKKVLKMSSSGADFEGKTAERGGKSPKCIRYILSNQFADGRERLIFTLISWYKASNVEPEIIEEKIVEWCEKQSYSMNLGQIRSKIRSNRGTIGCRWRHQLLEELGHDIEVCDWK